ncbi:MAG: hypothetical protein WAO28_04115 [Candidatus Microsaccharimonas sp.]
MTDPDNDIEATKERPSKMPYADMSTEMIKRATETDDPEMRADDMRGFLKNIAAAADRGEIVGSKNHVYTSEKFDAQLKEFARAFAHGPKEEGEPDTPALDFITRTKGLQGAFDALIHNDKTSAAFFEAINERVFPRPEVEDKPEFVPEPELVQEVGEKGVDAAELAEQSDEFTMEDSIDKASQYIDDVTPEEIAADIEQAEALAEPEAELVAEADAELETEGVPAELEVSEPEEVGTPAETSDTESEAETDHQTPAQKMRAAFEESKVAPEAPEKKESLLSNEDSELVHRFFDQMHRMSEGYTDPRDALDTEHYMKRFIGGVLVDMDEKLKKGTLSGEAYSFITGSLLGASHESRTLQDIGSVMYKSGELSEKDMNIIQDQFYRMDKINSLQGEEAEESRGRFLFDLEQTAYQVYSANDLKPNNLYLALSGMIAGQSTHFKGEDRRSSYASKAYSIISHIHGMKK